MQPRHPLQAGEEPGRCRAPAPAGIGQGRDGCQFVGGAIGQLDDRVVVLLTWRAQVQLHRLVEPT